MSKPTNRSGLQASTYLVKSSMKPFASLYRCSDTLAVIPFMSACSVNIGCSISFSIVHMTTGNRGRSMISAFHDSAAVRRRSPCRCLKSSRGCHRQADYRLLMCCSAILKQQQQCCCMYSVDLKIQVRSLVTPAVASIYLTQ